MTMREGSELTMRGRAGASLQQRRLSTTGDAAEMKPQRSRPEDGRVEDADAGSVGSCT